MLTPTLRSFKHRNTGAIIALANLLHSGMINQFTGGLLYRKADFEQLGGFDADLKLYADWERWLKAIANQQQGWTIQFPNI
ncbi:hypothetical protein [Nostoc sp.]|uniref:hypothetical protein n=1 Tax=Nostoc sp. TaxID=1180 RepID=UPI002FFA19AC